MDRLNLGSGPWYAEGWVNVDPVIPDPPHRAPDIQANLQDLAEDGDPHQVHGRFSRVYLGHVLEHIPWGDLPSFWAMLEVVAAPGATVMVVGPCLVRAIRTNQPENIIRAILADPRTPEGGLGHAWTPTTELTLEAVQLGVPYGLKDPEVLDVRLVKKPHWPNPDQSPWQVAVLATFG